MKLFYRNHNQVLTDIAKEFEIVEKMEDCDLVLLWNEVLPETRALVERAKSLGKKVFTVQHGRRGSSKYFPPFNMQIISDKLLVWGELDKKRLVAAGHDASKIEIIGTTIFSHLKPRKSHNDITIVFSPDHWGREIPENINVRNELRKLDGVKIVTKIIEDQDPVFYDNPIQSNRKQNDHLSICADVLSEADLVVSVADGTFELMANALDIPVITVEDWEPKDFGGDVRYMTYWRHISKGSKRTSLKHLLKTVKQQLKNPAELQKQRREICIEEGGLGLDTVKIIKELYENS